jgi:hypothetical protein
LSVLILGVICSQVFAASDQVSWRSVNTGADWAPPLQPKFFINAVVMRDADSFYVGGRFSSIGDITTPNVALWDGERWQTLGAGLASTPGIVDTLAVHQGELYATGSFTLDGKYETAAKSNGSVWSAVRIHEGPMAKLVQLYSYENVLYGMASQTGLNTQMMMLEGGDEWSPVGSVTGSSHSRILAMSEDRILINRLGWALSVYRKQPLGYWQESLAHEATYIQSAAIPDASPSLWSPTAFGSGSYMCVQVADRWYRLAGQTSDIHQVGQEIYSFGSLRLGTYEFENRIFRWSGRRFYPLSWTPDAAVKHMTGSDKMLVMAGNFGSVDGVASPGIIVGTWQPETPPEAEITRQPTSHSVKTGHPICLAVTASGKSLTYQWYELVGENQKQLIPGATGPECEVPGSADAASRSFQVRITHEGGMLDSDVAVVQVTSEEGAPEETVPPQSGIVLSGQDWVFAPKVSASPLATFGWSRNGVALSSKQAALTLKAVAFDGGGVFRANVSNPEGSVDLSPAYLAVVVAPPALVRVLAGNDALLRTVAKVPQDCSLSYQWLVDGEEIPGATQFELKLESVIIPDNGDYTCRLTLQSPAGKHTRTTNVTRLLVTQSPVVEAVSNQDHYVLSPVSLQLAAFSLETVRYTATGLPPGLKLDPASGKISGLPTTPRLLKGVPIPYKVKVTASNAAGAAVTEFDWLVRPLDAINVGTFYSVLGPQATMNSYEGKPPLEHELGTSVSLTATALGRCTGWIILAGQKLTFSGSIGGNSEPYSVLHHCKFTVRRKAPLSDVIVRTMVAGEGSGWMCHVFLDGKESWEQMIRPTGLPPATPAGRYNVRLSKLDPGSPSPPLRMGDGYASLQVARSGSITWTGKLPDGTSFTGAGWHGDAGDGLSRVMVQVYTHRNRGSFLTGGDCFIEGDRLSGTTMFYKAETPGVRALPAETRAPMRMEGGLLLANAYMGSLDYDFTPGPIPVIIRGSEHFYFSVDLTQDPLMGLVSERFRFKSGAAKALDDNLQAIRVTLNRTSGLATGDFVLRGETVKTDRKAAFSALMVPLSNTPRRCTAYGYLLLPELPDAVGETLQNTPLHSGNVRMD